MAAASPTTNGEHEGMATASSSRLRKRLVFCFDGTWNKVTAGTPTNVVLTAASIERVTSTKTTQIIHYDEGVGTGIREKYTGGIFGAGLVVNLREAYRFLIFNYDPGDEIFVFGFSRGAFTARSFAGLLRHVGVLRRLHVHKIDKAIELYKARKDDADGRSDRLRRFRADFADNTCIDADEDNWRCSKFSGHVVGATPLLKIKYLGLWDTVAALGVPAVAPGSSWFNRDHQYHDTSVSGFIENLRHAVALDEQRSAFAATLADGLDALNRQRGFDPADVSAPYQERWFPGVHGSVGGGGDIRGLSDGALHWVLEGAKRAGLELDTEKGTRIHDFAPDPLVPLRNVNGAKKGIMELLSKDRPGPNQLWQLSTAAIRRWQADPSVLGKDGHYRPGSLRRMAAALQSIVPFRFTPPVDIQSIETVKRNDTLTKIAQRVYGKAALYKVIFDANRDQLDDPDVLFPGQKLRIPHLNTAAAASSGSGMPSAKVSKVTK